MSTAEGVSPREAVSGVQFSANAVLDRLREAWGVTTDSALAERLDTSRQTISKWRSRNSVPYAEAIYTSNFCDISLNFLLKGVGDKRLDLTYFDGALDPEIVKTLLMHLISFGLIETVADIDGDQGKIDIRNCAEAIANGYAKILKTASLLTRDNHMTPSEARRIAIHAAEIGVPSSKDPASMAKLRIVRQRTADKGAQ